MMIYNISRSCTNQIAYLHLKYTKNNIKGSNDYSGPSRYIRLWTEPLFIYIYKIKSVITRTEKNRRNMLRINCRPFLH